MSLPQNPDKFLENFPEAVKSDLKSRLFFLSLARLGAGRHIRRFYSFPCPGGGRRNAKNGILSLHNAAPRYPGGSKIVSAANKFVDSGNIILL
jgi:hypothetical protein